MNIDNQKKFFQDIFLDENGNMVLVIDTKATPIGKGDNQYKTFKKIQLTPEGYLKVYE